MSILNKFKALSTRQTTKLFKTHPLANEPLELRLQYLSGLALLVAIDRAPHETEIVAFNNLAESLAIDSAEAKEQLDERANLTEEGMFLIFDALLEKKLGYLFLLDAAWLHTVDGNIEEAALDATRHISATFNIDSTEVDILHEFTAKIRSKDKAGLLPLIKKLPQDALIQSMTAHMMNFLFPCKGILEENWLDHGDGTITDIRTGLTWMRYCMGQKPDYSSGELQLIDDPVMANSEIISRKDYTYIRNQDFFVGAAKHQISRFQSTYGKEWRIPFSTELTSILTAYPSAFDAYHINNAGISTKLFPALKAPKYGILTHHESDEKTTPSTETWINTEKNHRSFILKLLFVKPFA